MIEFSLQCWGLNPKPCACQASILPLSYALTLIFIFLAVTQINLSLEFINSNKIKLMLPNALLSTRLALEISVSAELPSSTSDLPYLEQ